MKTKLSPPWVTFFNEVKAFFSHDEEVKIKFDPENYKIKVLVDNPAKAAALDKLLVHKKQFGNVTVTVDVIPGNSEDNIAALYEAAFDGNDVFEYVASKDVPGGAFNYVVWRFAACQFYNDNIGDVFGNCTKLASDVAADILQPADGVYHCVKPQI